jgi:predicted Zn finger-like uncharacterized protein
MFTVCPKCALTLVVTAADLRIAQGYVRCGRCSSVFNALPQLSDERPPPAAETVPSRPEPVHEADAEPEGGLAAEAEEAPASSDEDAEGEDASAEEGAGEATADEAASAEGEADQNRADELAAADDDAEDTAKHEVIPEGALEFNPDRTDLAAVFVAAPSDPQWLAATGTFKALSAANQERAARSDLDSVYLASVPRESAAASGPETPPVSEGETPAPPEAAAGDGAAAAETAAREPHPLSVPEADEEQAQAPPGRLLARVPPAAWRAAVPLALLLLLAQIVNHNRDDLAASARFGRPLIALYGALGVRLVPHWDVRAYDVRQLGAEASPPGSGLITVRASIKNAAARAQPLPLLRVTLQDRFGNRIAARDVAPRAYLQSAAHLERLLSAGQRVDAQMGFVDPGANAVGFEIDACLPASSGGITCANDVSTR